MDASRLEVGFQLEMHSSVFHFKCGLSCLISFAGGADVGVLLSCALNPPMFSTSCPSLDDVLGPPDLSVRVHGG